MKFLFIKPKKVKKTSILQLLINKKLKVILNYFNKFVKNKIDDKTFIVKVFSDTQFPSAKIFDRK